MVRVSPQGVRRMLGVTPRASDRRREWAGLPGGLPARHAPVACGVCVTFLFPRERRAMFVVPIIRESAECPGPEPVSSRRQRRIRPTADSSLPSDQSTRRTSVFKDDALLASRIIYEHITIFMVIVPLSRTRFASSLSFETTAHLVMTARVHGIGQMATRRFSLPSAATARKRSGSGGPCSPNARRPRGAAAARSDPDHRGRNASAVTTAPLPKAPRARGWRATLDIE